MWREGGKCTEKKLKWEIGKICLDGVERRKTNGAVWWNLLSSFSLSYWQALSYLVYLRSWPSHWNSHLFGSSSSGTWQKIGLLKRAQQPRDGAPLRSLLWDFAGKLWGHSSVVLGLWSPACWCSNPVSFQPRKTGPDKPGRNGCVSFSLMTITRVAFKVKLSTAASIEKSLSILANDIYLTACQCEIWLHINFQSHSKTYAITFVFNPENVFLSCM